MRKFLLLASVAVAASANAQVRIVVDGSEVATGSAPPMITKGRVMIPLRSVFEKLGAQVDWYPARGAMVLVTRQTTAIRLWIGSQIAQINQDKVTMDVAATNYGGNVRVPLRFISESVGAKVRWDSPSRTVYIDSPAGGRQFDQG